MTNGDDDDGGVLSIDNLIHLSLCEEVFFNSSFFFFLFYRVPGAGSAGT